MKLNESKQNVLNLVAKIISYGSATLISFFLTPYLIEKLGKEAYSFYPIANNFVSYMGVVTLALNSMSSRFITFAITKKENEKANTYFSSIFYGNLFVSLFSLIPLSIIVLLLDKILDIPLDLVTSVKVLFSLVFISMMVNLITNVFGVATFSQNRLDLASVSEIVLGVIRVVLYLLLFLFFTPKLIYIGIIAVIISILTFFIQVFFTKKLIPEIKIKREYLRFSAIKEVVSSGAWNSVNQIGIVLLSNLGLILCNSLYGVSEGADYSAALTIPQFVNGIVSTMSTVFLPMLTIKFVRDKRESVIDHVHLSQTVIASIINIPIAVFMGVGMNFYALWMPVMDSQKLYYLSCLALCYIVITSVAHPVGNLNTVMNRVKVPALVMLFSGTINIVLIYLFYKFTDLGVYSIPLIQCVIFVINRGLFVCIYSAKCLKEKVSVFYPVIFKNIISTVLIVAVSYSVNKLINPTSWIMLIIECAFLAVVGLASNVMIIITPKKLVAFLHELKRDA